jgi:D-glycero-alpha-D-manno-heptose-7-phosphate kinase
MATSVGEIKRIDSKAPTRIDLAGGTVDLWPLYLFLDKPVTLNLGIDLYAETRLELSQPSAGGDGTFTLKSEDQGHEATHTWSTLETATAPPQLELHLKLLRYFARERASAVTAGTANQRYGFDLTLSTRARSPAGAGLGGSSTLSVSMSGALATWARQGTRKENFDAIRDGEEIIQIVRDVETTVIQVPAGVQDYYGAMFGGLQSLRWGAGKHEREWLPEGILADVQKHLLLFYSGQSRNSGINNWALFKGFIDNQNDIRARFGKIAQATHRLEQALMKRDWSEAGLAIADEWATRKTLAQGITTPEMEKAFEEARGIAKISGKVCGAGGGGCFFVYLEDGNDEDAKKRIQEAFTAQGIRPLPFHAVPRGLEVRVTRA